VKVLIVAPNFPELAQVPDEVASLANRVPNVLLQGSVTSERVISALDDEPSFEGFWFATHANDQGVVLNGPTILTPYEIAAYANAADCEWIVLNTCGSRRLVAEIQMLSTVDIVATESDEIADTAAWQFARLLAIEFGRTGNMRTSVHTVAPGGSRHRYYENERRTIMTRQYPTPSTQGQPQEHDFRKLEDKVDVLTGLVDGDNRRGVVGLREQSGEILRRLSGIEERIGASEHESADVRSRLTTAYYILIALVVGVATLTGAVLFLYSGLSRF